jgi:hypothetical protein
MRKSSDQKVGKKSDHPILFSVRAAHSKLTLFSSPLNLKLNAALRTQTQNKQALSRMHF